jgi:protein gp37
VTTMSAIEWCDATWNPTTGCTKVSPACANCFIERQTPMRVAGRKFVKGDIPIEFHENRLDVPLRRRKPTTYFVNSMSDLFHADVPDAFIDRVFAVMALARRHTFQVLTKRSDRMHRYVSALKWERLIECCNQAGDGGEHRPGFYNLSSIDALSRKARFVNGEKSAFWPLSKPPLPNVWLGVSVENQHFADERIPLLLQTPAAVRFLSCEPLLGPINIQKPCSRFCSNCRGAMEVQHSDEGGIWTGCPCERVAGLHWVIAGGESGPRRRETDIAWARGLRDQCAAAGVPFFWKQNGGPTSKSGGRLLDGRSASPALRGQGGTRRGEQRQAGHLRGDG